VLGVRGVLHAEEGLGVVLDAEVRDAGAIATEIGDQRVVRVQHQVVSMVAACVLAASSVASPASAVDDALQRRVLSELKGFTDWLAANDAEGFIGEVGWPNGHILDEDTGEATFRPGESEKWNALANEWYKAADAAKLWVTAFSAGEIMSADHPLRIYGSSNYVWEEPTPIDTADLSASVVEAHPTTADYMRGVHDFGGAICHDHDENKSFFSNRTPYVYTDSGKHSATFRENSCYHYSTPASLAFLADHGVKLVRLDFRWEHIQEKVGGELRADDIQHIVDYVHAAQAAGLTTVLDLHNYAHLLIWKKPTKRGVSAGLGSKRLPIAAFADVWKRLSDVFKAEPNVVYDLMNEPQDLGSDAADGARIWEQASQAALDAIRANGDTHPVMVEGYEFASVERWAQNHPTGWITDPENNFRYEGHHYFDRNHSGYYTHTYDEEVADAASDGAA
jgi:hypothetical protein